MNLILFDVDGTLLDSVGYESGLYGDAITEVLDEEVDRNWSRYRHVTDGGVLDEIIAQRPRSWPAANIHQRVHDAFVAKLQMHFARHPQAVREIPGARAWVKALARRGDCAVGIATGGWHAAAALKLAAIGLDQPLALATGSDARARTAIMQLAAQRALAGRIPARRIYFGDREWDRAACDALGFEFIAVGDAVDFPRRIADYTRPERVLEMLALS